MAIANGMMDPGNVMVMAPYFISGKTGALTVPAAGSPIATLQNLGRLSIIDGPGAPIIPVPLRISQIRTNFVLTSGATSTVAFEVFKGAVTTQHTVGGNARVPTSRKTIGYPAIVAAEINLFIATTAAISGGTFVPDGDPIEMIGVTPNSATFGFGESNWVPIDTCPLTLEAGQGLEVRVTQQGGAAVGIFHMAIDFMRQ